MTDLFETTAASSPGSDGVWLTIAELAKRKGISRQSASERINRLEQDGLIATRRDGRSRLVELATFDRAVGQTGNAFREQGAETKRETTEPPTAALRDAQTQRAQYESKLKALDYAERTGQLVPIKGDHGVETALVKATEVIIRELGAPLNWVSEILDTVRDGEPALRRLLRKKIHKQREVIAARLTAVAGEAAEAERVGVQVDLDFGGEE
ncbi:MULTISPECIES: winged helix-turn-helix domain-containing protein [Rhizobium]|uniref:winged helix-turn-helix domain-containing protein n=1 Tax=Rhizobium TaxID=379 RepID=UPI0013B707B3|nr:MULTISPECIES: winged helix-turn-helix domain-containing protein [Rhizobium]MBY2918877.1 winged helix-turn-helix transcriptional regulator [Rhizobium leguminosarum]MBY2974528.1 winged helix-turn-helix transcriptional regulator [Rhizobium leguminosarum]MBY2982007.1 winged helix-turn-helix transcriptional regulator [Rhizobium leguminosarum]MBY3010477.1 winged helix-turn-helix transcriptional regulator [Rhizobium leguminosarum]NEJ10441.1 MarR family transcriptional regulator [Rhizobium ruizargu